jgi:hypothetical protein
MPRLLGRAAGVSTRAVVKWRGRDSTLVVEVNGLRLEVTGVQDGQVKEVRIGRAPAAGSPTGH